MKPQPALSLPQSSHRHFVRIRRGEHSGAVVTVIATELSKWFRVVMPDGSPQWLHRADVEHID